MSPFLREKFSSGTFNVVANTLTAEAQFHFSNFMLVFLAAARSAENHTWCL